MHDTRQVEEILSRLMPVSLSGSCQAEIESMIDDLAATAVRPARPWWKRWTSGGGIAAAGVAAAMVFKGGPSPQRVDLGLTATEDIPGFILVSERNRVESMSDEGWVEDFDGSAMQAMRLSLVEENTLRDEETGIVMSISEPREEVLLMPVSNF